jgi:hypothetical protein
MSVSTFTVYSSADASGPGPIFGSAGDLLRVLDLVLVNGYTGKSAAGWSKPIANSGNLGCYKQGGGALLTLYVNDNGPNATSTTKEAWITGWESISALTAPVGVGSGQFPIPSQALTTGHLVVRKSATADGTTQRSWIIFADAYTFYMFINAGDQVATYNGNLFFGDVFSLKGSSDTYRCMIRGAVTENVTGINSAVTISCDQIAGLGSTNPNHPGFYMARTYGGQGASIAVMQQGDIAKTAATTANAAMVGICQIPNGPDSSIYMDAVGVAEFSALCDRGRMRGMYHICHPLVNFADGQVFQGMSDFAAKTFQIVKQGATAGMWAMEISASLETN